MTNSPTSSRQWTFQDVVEYFAPDLKAVEEAIFAHLRSRNELLEKIGTYITASGGKRLRPLLVVLCARMNGYQGNDHIALGNIVEYLHAATLLHDDVLDKATVRRGARRPTTAGAITSPFSEAIFSTPPPLTFSSSVSPGTSSGSSPGLHSK